MDPTGDIEMVEGGEDDNKEIDSPEQHPVDIDHDFEAATPMALPASAAVKDPDGLHIYQEHISALPYQAESVEEMDRRLDLILRRILDCVATQDYDVGLIQWSHRLECWLGLRAAMKREIRARLVNLYYHLAIHPGMEPRIVDGCANMVMNLLKSKKRLDINDLVLDWKPLYQLLERELFPKKRRTGQTNVSLTLLRMTDSVQRFFAPSQIMDMLSTFLPRFNGDRIDSILATQSFLVHFLPTSHPTEYLPAVFSLWEGYNSGVWDAQWLDFLARLSAQHVNPNVSSPKRVQTIDTIAAAWPVLPPELASLDRKQLDLDPSWKGIRKDVGIYTHSQFNLIMTKCLRSMKLQSAIGGAVAVRRGSGPAQSAQDADASATQSTLSLTKVSDVLESFADIIVFSMAQDAPVASGEAQSTAMTPATSSTGSIVNVSLPTASCVAGSYALDAVVRFLQATESFFHPSNAGAWSGRLTSFISKLAGNFLRRWMEEQRADCTTPMAWRLTPLIKEQFVLSLRTVSLLSIYSKDKMAVMSSGITLRTLAALQPDLIIPAVLERAFPALENVIETHRTTSTLTTLAMVAVPMISRHIYPAGAKHVLPLLDLCIPGIDLNDPFKTLSTCMFIVQVFEVIGPVANLNSPEYASLAKDQPSIVVDGDLEQSISNVKDENSDAKLSREEEDQLLKETTSQFPDWLIRCIKAVLALIENLPEPGKGGKTGGKIEEVTITSVASMLQTICDSLVPELFDDVFRVFFNHVAHSPRANSARVIASLTAAFSKAYPDKVFSQIFPLCDRQIRSELAHGACSSPSTSTSAPMDGDTAFQWYCYLLSGACSSSGEAMISAQDQIISLLQYMVSTVRSERGYNHVGRLIASFAGAAGLASVRNMNFSGLAAREDPQVNVSTSHERWGNFIDAKDAIVDWHVPSKAEIDFVIRIVTEVAEPAVTFLENHIQHSAGRGGADKIWANDFCRHLVLLKYLFPAIASLIQIPRDAEEPGVPISDGGDEHLEFIDHRPDCTSHISLRDPNDARYKAVFSLRQRSSELLHNAITGLKNNGAEDAIDCVRMLISTSKTLLHDYPIDRAWYDSIKKSFEFAKSVTRLSKAQKQYPNFVWARRAAHYEAIRSRTSSFYRRRSARDDLLILDLAELSLSPYLAVRKAAQRALELAAQYYDGSRSLIMAKLFEALKPGTDPDRMKGSLYLLRSKLFGNIAIVDWRYTGEYMLTLLQCSHQEKPSIQALIKQLCSDFVVRLVEPSSLRSKVVNPELTKSADILSQLIKLPVNDGLQTAVAAKFAARSDRRDSSWAELMPQLLALAKSPSTHWRYKTLTTRFLRALLRRDQVVTPDLASFMAEEVVSPLSPLRVHAILSTTKILHFIKLRAVAKDSASALLLQSAPHPLKKRTELPTPVPKDFTKTFLATLQQPLNSRDSLLSDKQSTGWLVWSKTVEFYRPPSEDESPLKWDAETSAVALEAIRKYIVQESWWDKLCQQLAQETGRAYLAADNTILLKSIFQIYEDDCMNVVRPKIETLLLADDRHKQRAGLEVLAGMLRGTKHWPLRKQREVWSWVTPLIAKLIDLINPDNQESAEMMIDYVLMNRDPRRNKPLIDYLTSLEVDLDSTEAFSQAKKAWLVNATAVSLGWHFQSWAPTFQEQYWPGLSTTFQELRSAVTEILRTLAQLQQHPSYTSVEDFLAACRDKGVGVVNTPNNDVVDRLAKFSAQLESWRRERKPAALGSQNYDNGAMSILMWLLIEATGTQLDTAYPMIKQLLPDIFKMQEIQDNDELKGDALMALVAVANMPFPAQSIPDILRVLLGLLKESDSWRIRLDVLPICQVFFFNQIFFVDEALVQEMMETLCELLHDASLEVREAAATTLCGIIRCSQRRAILALKDRFLHIVRTNKLPRRRNQQASENANYQRLLQIVHSGVLGAAALINSHPYDVPSWMPALLIEVMGEHNSSPAPISTTVRKCLADFKKSHQDSWVEDQKAFDADQLMQLSDLLIPANNYYA